MYSNFFRFFFSLYTLKSQNRACQKGNGNPKTQVLNGSYREAPAQANPSARERNIPACNSVSNHRVRFRRA
jgi:hypothetical protein